MAGFETVFWGVFSGIVTALILFVLGKVAVHIVVPWYQRLIYKGVDLRGRWVSRQRLESGVSYHYQVDVSQNAHQLTGHAVITKSGSDQDYVQDFAVEGEVWEGYVMLNLRSQSRVNLSLVTGLFKVEQRGLSLQGSWAYRGNTEDSVHCEALKLVRE